MARTIPLNHGYVAVVDEADYEQFAQYRWHVTGLSGERARKHHYAARAVYHKRPDGTRKQQLLLMHRELMQARPDENIDHVDGDGLNNCRGNLRVATPRQNMQNMQVGRHAFSRFKGVGKSSSGKKFRVRIKVGGKDKFLGDFVGEDLAAKTYDRAALYYYGIFACTNFPRQLYEGEVEIGGGLHENS